jgi:hypothetical protein
LAVVEGRRPGLGPGIGRTVLGAIICGLGTPLAWVRQLRLAAAVQRVAVRLAPENVEVRHRLAEALWRCGLESDAVEEYRALAAMRPRSVAAQYELGFVLRHVGRCADPPSAGHRA